MVPPAPGLDVFGSSRLPAAARRLSLLALASALLAGCATPLAPTLTQRETADVPRQWAAATPAPAGSATPAQDLAGWWRRFDEPLIASLVTQALAANTDVRQAVAALRQARAATAVSQAGLLPQLDGSGSAQRSRSGERTSDSFRVGFDAGWEPDLFGRLRAGVDAAQAEAQASVATLGQVQVSVAAEVAVQLLTLRGLQARLAIAEDNLAAQAETLQLTRWRAQAGLVTSLDVEQARAALEQTRAQVPALRSSIGQTVHALSVLTGQPPAALDRVLAAPAPVTVPQPPDDIALAFPADTLRQRPDVQAAEQRLRAALSRVTQADAARYPSLRLSGSLGLSALTLGGLSGSGAGVGALLASLSAPLFDGGAGRAQVRVQQAAVEQAEAAYRGAVLEALREVEDALVALRNDRERLGRLRDAAEAARNAAIYAQQSYAGGLSDFQTVLQTQRTLLSAQDALASAEATLATDHVRLYKALGGGWTPGRGEVAAAPAATGAPPGASTGAASSAIPHGTGPSTPTLATPATASAVTPAAAATTAPTR